MTPHIFVPFLVLSIALPALACSGETDSITHTSVGEMLPEIDFSTVEGARVTNESLKGSVVVLNFFATWCGPCISELPRLEKEVWEPYRGEGFKLFVIGREHTAPELNAFRKEKGFTFPIAEDPKREMYGHFANESIPRTYVIDRDGTILYQSIGYEPKEFTRMVGVIEDALKTDAKSANTAAKPSGDEAPAQSSGLKSVTVSGETRIRVQSWDR